MLDYVYHALTSFQNDFSRQRTWLIFCAIIFCLMISTEMIGVTSMCRFWFQGEPVYRSLIRFFRSDAYCYHHLLERWNRFVLQQNKTVDVDGRCVLLDDHTHVVKDGRRMPGVVSMRETSETQSKPSYFRGQCWGRCRCLSRFIIRLFLSAFAVANPPRFLPYRT